MRVITTTKKQANNQRSEYEGWPDSSDFRQQIVKDRQALEVLAGQWEKVWPASESAPMQQAAWSMACLRQFAADSAAVFAALNTENELVAIAPLMTQAGAEAAYEFPGMAELYEPCDLIYRDAASLNILLKMLSELNRPILFARVPADSPVPGALRKIFRKKAIVRCKQVDGCPFIPLDRNDPETVLPAKLRSDLRRAQRKAAAGGVVSFDILNPASEAEFLPLYEEAMEVEASGWKHSAGTALAVDTRRRQFFRDYGVSASRQGLLRMAFLRIDGVAVAMQLAVESASRFWLLKVGYREEYSRCSPGLLLMLETLRYATKQRLVSYELLGSPAPWTRRWTTLERPNVLIEIYPFSVAGFRGILKRCRDAASAWRDV